MPETSPAAPAPTAAPGEAGPAPTGFAEFDAEGRLLAHNAAMIETGAAPLEIEPGDPEPVVLAAILGRFVEISGAQRGDPGRIAAALARWQACAGGIEALGADGRWRLLSGHLRADGGRSYHAVDITQERRRDAFATRILAESPLAIWAVEAESGQIAFANLAARELFGAEAADDSRALLKSFVMPHQRVAIAARPEGQGRVDFMDALVETPDGRRLWSAGATKGITLAGRALTLCAMFDTTESSQQDHERSRALELLGDAIQALDQALVLYDNGMRFVMANDLSAEVLFRDIAMPPPGEPLFETIARLVATGFFQSDPDVSPEAFAGGLVEAVRAYSKNVEMPAADGRWLLASSHKTRLGGWLIEVKDVTDRRRAERAEREADMLVRTIVESSPTAFLVTRVADGAIVYAPRAARESFGEGATTLDFFLDPKDREAYLAALLPTGRVDDYPVAVRRRDGSVMHGLTSARVVDYKGEDVIISSTRDITEQLAMQEELERQREIAHQTEKLSALGELLAGVSHELNNPLSIIVGYSMMLQDKVEDPDLRRRVDRIAQAAERCTKIVRTFLAMARKRPARIEPCRLNEVIEVALDVAGYGLRTQGAEIVTRLAEDLPLVDADPDQMAQVFTNLIVNAEHAMAGQSGEARLELVTRHDARAREVVAEIADTGPGIPAEIQARIFEPFFTTKEVGAGTGVGLAFCHRIVEAHNGRLGVVSAPGRGARFVLRLPARAEEAAEAAEEAPEAPAPAPRRVLVVEDEPDVGEVVCDMLREAGYEAEHCLRAADALDRLAAERFDAILSDIRMPEMDGGGFLEALAGRLPHLVPRLGFLTGDTLSPGVEALLGRSGRPHLAKPVEPGALAALVSALSEDSP